MFIYNRGSDGTAAKRFFMRLLQSHKGVLVEKAVTPQPREEMLHDKYSCPNHSQRSETR